MLPVLAKPDCTLHFSREPGHLLTYILWLEGEEQGLQTGLMGNQGFAWVDVLRVGRCETEDEL